MVNRPRSGRLARVDRVGETHRLRDQGLTNREIAERLVLSDRTIDNHVQHVMDKLGMHRRTQITKWVVEQGLVPKSSSSDRIRV